MAIELITGYAGSGHISSADAGRYNAGICGLGKYVLGTGTKFEATVVSGNLVRIGSGDAVDQGRHIIIPQNSTEDARIENGSQNRTRIDVITLRYNKDTSTGIEHASLEVIRGTEVSMGGTPSAPAVISGNIFNGAAQDDLPLYHVLIEGTQIEEVTKVYQEIPSLAEMGKAMHPVGTAYISFTNVNPGEVFGGTWVEEAQGKLLLGRSADHPAGSTGGKETVTLTEAQLPAHKHTGPNHTHTVPEHGHTASSASDGWHQHGVYRNQNAASGSKRYAIQGTAGTVNSIGGGAHSHAITVYNCPAMTTSADGTGDTGLTGGGEAINIMNPFIAVYIWRRIA